MRSTEKHVLFAQQKIDGKVHVYPLSVHVNAKSAAAHKSLVSIAHQTGDVERVKALAPKVKTTTDGKLHDNIKFAVVELPYEPQAETVETSGDTFDL